MTELTRIGEDTKVTRPTVAKNVVAISQDAARKVLAMSEKEGKVGQLLRVGIQGGGCSGLSYTFAFVAEPEARDKVFEAYGARIVVDPKSLIYLGGSVLDWKESLMKSGFVFSNPNEVKSCSCGESFSI